jgi:hypothetical protein
VLCDGVFALLARLIVRRMPERLAIVELVRHKRLATHVVQHSREFVDHAEPSAVLPIWRSPDRIDQRRAAS